MAGIEISDVSMTYRDGTRAVDGLDLTVRDGELLVLVGPSGSGKSTALRLIAGLEEPTSGVIRIGGQDMRGVAPRRRNIAMVFQGLGLLGNHTARENLRLGLRLTESSGRSWFSPRGAKAADEDELVAWGAKLLGIERLLDKPVGELSGGEQQRVAIGRALVRRPAAFLLDEPLANLDPPTRLVLRREICRLQRELEVTMVYVTHDQAEALALGDRIATLHAGRLQQVGTPDALYRQPRNRFVASLFGSHGMNFLEGRTENSQSGRIAAVGPWRLPLATLAASSGNGKRSDRVVLGVRPEDTLATSEPRTGAFPAEVEQTEYQGNETFALVRMEARSAAPPATTLTVRCGNRAPPRGATVYVSLCEDNLCWFDPETGENWACRGERAK